MFIDKVLSRFKIRTKVLMFVLPFVVTISGVGLTGLYAAGLLEGRMQISNGILQSLSGFKDLYGSMGDFLQVTNEDARDKLYADITSQEKVLEDNLGQIGQKNGREKLESAIAGTAQMASVVAEIWTLHGDELDDREKIAAALKRLVTGRFDVSYGAQQLQASIRGDDGRATATLRAADRLFMASETLAAIVAKFETEPDASKKIKILVEASSNIKSAQRSIAISAPKNQKAAAMAMVPTVEGVMQLANSSDASSGQSLPEGLRLIARIDQMSAFAQANAIVTTREAKEAFAARDVRTAQTDSVLEATRRLDASLYSLQLVLGEFSSETTQENRKRLKQAVGTLQADLGAVVEKTQGIQFAEGKNFVSDIIEASSSIDANSASLLETIQQRDETYMSARTQLDDVWKELTAFAELQKQSAGNERVQANGISVLTTGLGIFLSILGGFALVLTLQRPISQITMAMRRLADGTLDTSILGEGRCDEIGDMARALGVFKENAISKIRIEEQSYKEREAAEHERQRNDADKREMDRHIEFAVNQLAAGLERMAQGDISTTIDTPFVGRMEQLRKDFNGSMTRLQVTIGHVRDNIVMIRGNGSQMAQSVEDLARRTERQAASLEEAAAAVDQITTTIRSSAERASDADQIVRQAKRSADDSASVVGKAIDAMGRIEDASRQIEQIIGVIDEIAFQTNLLALNAGVEAARAGEAGKGFAVVAMEVRELAQRSAAAAREIKGLINKSSTEVSSGSQSVRDTGTALAKISAQIVTINEHVEMIARASQEQSRAIQEVNSTVNQMDQMTQQNAAMVEETNAASRALADEADALLQLVQQFTIESESPPDEAQAA
ncbi:hypothetical protein N182_29935 [Sinorhizobium sp. GL2]|nr:hypothetical protein N182_29935 [Sinorhizobium sp. GL2]